MDPPRANARVLNFGLVFHSLPGEHPLDVRPNRLIEVLTGHIENRPARNFLGPEPLPSRIARAYPYVAEVPSTPYHSGRHVFCDELQLLQCPPRGIRRLFAFGVIN